MKTHQITLTGCVLIAFMVSPTLADTEKAKAEEIPAAVLKNQTHCPVMGGKIDSTVYTDIQGQRVYHCCPACSKPLKKDPDKFFKKAAAEGVLFENIQTICPVSGKELEKKTAFIEHDGRHVYLCCEGCAGEFTKDPQKYLTILTDHAEKAKKADKPDKPEVKDNDSHKGHNH